MTYQEYTQLLSQLPEHLRKEYGFNEPFDYSPYKCIHTDEYDYYPELDCCIINNIPIIWESGHPWVTPENPEILKGFKKFIKPRLKEHIQTIYVNPNGTITCCSYNNLKRNFQMMQKHGNTSFVNINGSKIWYNPNDIDLANEPETIKLARCLFWAQEHESIGLAPDKKEPVEDWTCVEFIGDKNNEKRD